MINQTQPRYHPFLLALYRPREEKKEDRSSPFCGGDVEIAAYISNLEESLLKGLPCLKEVDWLGCVEQPACPHLMC
jgi:hypothetical protein